MPLRFLHCLLLIFGAAAIANDRRAKLGETYAASADVGRELLGSRPPELQVREWLHSQPLTLASLRGKVVLIRWWTGPQCEFCTASADALNSLWKMHRERGLVVIGMYHHKAATPLTREHVQTQAQRLGFEFPIGIDENWVTLRRWWLAKEDRRWTSVTFLLDREGVIRHIHPGGAYFAGEPGYEALAAAVEKELQ